MGDKMKYIYNIKWIFQRYIEMHYELNMRQIMLKTEPNKIKTKILFNKSYHVKCFRICLEPIFLGLLVNILSHMYVFRKFRTFFSGEKKIFSLYLPGSSKAKRNNIFKLKKKYWSQICNFRFGVSAISHYCRPFSKT